MWKIACNSWKTKTCSFKYIIVFTVLIKILIESMLRHVKRVTHWKPTQKFKFKLVNISKSYSQHNHQVYFRNKFCFISSKLYLIFITQWLICAALYTVRFTEPYWFANSMNHLLTYKFHSYFGPELETLKVCCERNHDFVKRRFKDDVRKST